MRGVAQLVARYVRDVEVAGSNLVTPTKNLQKNADNQCVISISQF